MVTGKSDLRSPGDGDRRHQTTVLAIDDDPDMRHLIKVFLGQQGIKVLTFSNGIEAISAGIDPNEIDCILLDMNLAEERGTDVSSLIRTLPSTADVPIIFLSASDDQNDILRALRAGANDYLRKPFHTEELTARIRVHSRISLQRRQLEEQNKLLQRRNEESIVLNARAVMLQEVVKQYTPKSTWAKADIAALEGMIDIPDEEVEVTLLFLDIKSFTAFAEQWTTAEVISSLNELFDPMTAIIDAEGGDIDKFIGDSIFAIFSESLPAVRAAQKIQEAAARINENRGARGAAELMVRVGLNRGTVVRGNVGGSSRKENTLIGDAVNVASRIEKACAPGRVLLSETVVETAGDGLRLEDRQWLKAKGKEELLAVYYLVGVD